MSYHCMINVHILFTVAPYCTGCDSIDLDKAYKIYGDIIDCIYRDRKRLYIFVIFMTYSVLSRRGSDYGDIVLQKNSLHHVEEALAAQS